MEYKDPSVSQNAILTLSEYIIKTYPYEPIYDDNLFVALRLISEEYLNIENDNDNEEIRLLSEKIKRICNEN